MAHTQSMDTDKLDEILRCVDKIEKQGRALEDNEEPISSGIEQVWLVIYYLCYAPVTFEIT